MAAKRAEPDQPEPRREREPPRRDPEAADEQTGPVAIARHRKGDGRALILYTREPPA
jgi:hypothetical protein